MNTENKLPVLRPEDKPVIPEPADTAAPAGEKASRWKRPETHEEKMLFWMRVTVSVRSCWQCWREPLL